MISALLPSGMCATPVPSANMHYIIVIGHFARMCMRRKRPHQGLSSWAWARATAAIRSCPVRREAQAALPDLQAVPNYVTDATLSCWVAQHSTARV
jgi:hypothetical protein